MESLHALSGAYAIDALDDDERAVFERHLPNCLDCQREVASLREAAALMADLSAVTPPPALRASVLAGITKIRPLPPVTAERGELAAGTIDSFLLWRRCGGCRRRDRRRVGLPALAGQQPRGSDAERG